MNWADIAILSIIGISVIISFFRGFLREALSLLVWILAFWIAWTFFREVAPWFGQWVSAPSLQMALAFTAIVIAVVLIGGLVTWIIGNLVDKTGLSGTDRVVGLLFGAARGVVIVAIVVLLAGATPFPQDPWWKESQLLPHFQTVAVRLKEMLPTDIGKYLEFTEGDASKEKAENKDDKTEESAGSSEKTGV